MIKKKSRTVPAPAHALGETDPSGDHRTTPPGDLAPHVDRILTPKSLAQRWDVHPKVAMRRARKMGLPILKFTERSVGVRLSDLLEVEQQIVIPRATPNRRRGKQEVGT
jgi:hypothetical protein